MTKKMKVISSIMCAMLAISAVSVPALAAEDTDMVQTEQMEPTVVSSNTARLVITFLQSDGPGWRVENLANDSCKFTGSTTGYSLYTGKYTGKYTYYITILNGGASESPIRYEVRNATSYDQVMKSGTVNPGQKVVVEAGGFATTSQMFVKFIPTNGSADIDGVIS